MAKHSNIKTSAEFRRVYMLGKRYDSRLMTVFVLSNDSLNHRLGLTASRKAIGNAVQRNRSKRILREMFRSSEEQTKNLQQKYDWVINAKRKLLCVKTQDAIGDFLKIIAIITRDEKTVSGEAGK